MPDVLIGIAGGGGRIGRALVTHLRAGGCTRLRVGSRHARAAATELNEEHVHLDIDDPSSLTQFCTGCRIVVNCAGPAYRVRDRVARAAFRAEADYVDPGGDEPLFALLAPHVGTQLDGRAVLSAGFMPGLTGLLPRWLARQGFTRARCLTAYTCIRDRFTHAAAVDYLDSLRNGYGAAQSIWRKGAIVRAQEPPRVGIVLPFLSGEASVYPYFTREAERLARALALEEADWYTVFDGPNMWRTLARLSQVQYGPDGMVELARELVRAAEVDLFGRSPEQTLIFRLAGAGLGRELERTLIVRVSSTYDASALLCALVVFALIAEEIPCGVHFAADRLDPIRAAELLKSAATLTSFELLDGPLENGADEGVV